jgi:transcriptional regulator
MYTPGFYRETRMDLIEEVIENYGFATLLTPGSDDSISHLPFILQSGEKPVLLGHMARANPHWKVLEKSGKAKVIFQGPHGYISPSWYVPAEDNVPTWNYAVVHVSGSFELISDQRAAYSDMQKLVNKFETDYQSGWTLPESEPEIENLLKHITVFRITDLEFTAKFKLSQK